VGLLLAEAQLLSQCEAGQEDEAGRSVDGALTRTPARAPGFPWNTRSLGGKQRAVLSLDGIISPSHTTPALLVLRSYAGALREFLGDVLCESASLRKTINTLLRSSVVRVEHERSRNGENSLKK
jgi:hypothetical protein